MQRLSAVTKQRLESLYLTEGALGTTNLCFRLFLDIDHTLLSTQSIYHVLKSQERFQDPSTEKLRALCIKCEEHRLACMDALKEGKPWPDWTPSAHCEAWGDAGETITCEMASDEECPEHLEYKLPFLKQNVYTYDGRVTHYVFIWGYIWKDLTGQPGHVYAMTTVVPAEIASLYYIRWGLPTDLDALRCKTAAGSAGTLGAAAVQGVTTVELRLASCGGPAYVRSIHRLLKILLGDVFAAARSFPQPTDARPSPKSIEAFKLDSSAPNTAYFNIVADDQAAWWPESVRNHSTAEQLVPPEYYGCDCTADVLVRMLDVMMSMVGTAAFQRLQQALQQKQQLEDARRSSTSSGSTATTLAAATDTAATTTGARGSVTGGTDGSSMKIKIKKRKATSDAGAMEGMGTPVKAVTTSTARSPLKLHLIRARALDLGSTVSAGAAALMAGAAAGSSASNKAHAASPSALPAVLNTNFGGVTPVLQAAAHAGAAGGVPPVPVVQLAAAKVAQGAAHVAATSAAPAAAAAAVVQNQSSQLPAATAAVAEKVAQPAARAEILSGAAAEPAVDAAPTQLLTSSAASPVAEQPAQHPNFSGC